MDKKAVREKLLEKTSQDLTIDRELVDRVISWSYHRANEATRSNKEVEISGFGTFLISNGKIKRKLRSVKMYLERMGTVKEKTEEEKEKILNAEEALAFYTSKLR